jgi:MFS family permease
VHEKLSAMKYGILLTKRGFLVNLIFSFIFFTLYFVFSIYVIRHVIPSADNRPVVQASFHFIIVIALLLTSFFIHRFNKLRVIYACSIVTSIVAVLLFFVSNDIFRLIFIFVIAIFFSTGQLAFFTYFWNSTVSEERGRIAGLIGFVSFPFYFIIDPIVAETLDFPGIIMLSIVLSLGLLLVILLRPEKAVLTAKKDERGNYSEKRTVLLYSIPWVLFSLNNVTLAKNISLNILQQVPSSLYLSLTILQAIGVIFGALSGGIIADFFGRRLSLAFSLTLYGISSALAGLFTNDKILSFVYIANGLSWGILLILYSFVVWGDLANKENCAKMYSIGLIIYYSTMGIGLFPTQISQIPLVVSALASCLLIFLSNIPIILAPELLPSDFREKIKLKLHMRAVRKIRKQSQNQG